MSSRPLLVSNHVRKKQLGSPWAEMGLQFEPRVIERHVLVVLWAPPYQDEHAAGRWLPYHILVAYELE
jgi:hypothetical protein